MLESDLLKEKSKLKEIISTINCVLVDEKKDLEELSPVGNKVNFTIKPYEIKTFKFKLR